MGGRPHAATKPYRKLCDHSDAQWISSTHTSATRTAPIAVLDGGCMRAAILAD